MTWRLRARRVRDDPRGGQQVLLGATSVNLRRSPILTPSPCRQRRTPRRTGDRRRARDALAGEGVPDPAMDDPLGIRCGLPWPISPRSRTSAEPCVQQSRKRSTSPRPCANHNVRNHGGGRFSTGLRRRRRRRCRPGSGNCAGGFGTCEQGMGLRPATGESRRPLASAWVGQEPGPISRRCDVARSTNATQGECVRLFLRASRSRSCSTRSAGWRAFRPGRCPSPAGPLRTSRVARHVRCGRGSSNFNEPARVLARHSGWRLFIAH